MKNKLYVRKRDGKLVPFKEEKIINAVLAAFEEVDGEITDQAKEKAENIASYITQEAQKSKTDLTVEEIQDFCENGLMSCRRKDVAKAFILQRQERSKFRGNTTDKSILELLCGKNDYWNNENSNKDAKVVTVQRDYLAGITSTDIARRFLLPKEVCEAHDEGIIHEHDCDYLAQMALNNCCLINLEDMLQNGTVINGVMIEKPHRLLTATTIATQIITAVASSQQGGSSITLSHLAPFVRDSRNYYREKYAARGLSRVQIAYYVDQDLKKEISDAVQTFNYQVNSMSTTNGQSPFLSVMMYLDENEEYRGETALLIEEFLKQRILGMKNEQGVQITASFPKLLYVLDENNITEDSPYWYLTKLAAECTAKRMVPDYISAKIMRKLKGAVYPCINKLCA